MKCHRKESCIRYNRHSTCCLLNFVREQQIYARVNPRPQNKYNAVSFSYFWTRKWSHIVTDLAVLLVVLVTGPTSAKKPDRIKSAHDEVGRIRIDWQSRIFDLAAMTSFHEEKCCHPLSALHTKRLPRAYAAASASSCSVVHSCLVPDPYEAEATLFYSLWVTIIVTCRITRNSTT